MIFDRWLAERVYYYKGWKFEEYIAMCDRGEIEGLEPGCELDEIWSNDEE